jgi:hypothetical protein
MAENRENSSVRTPAIRSSHLPGIGEEEPARNTREEAGRDRDEGDVNYGNSNIRESMAFVPSSSTVAEGNRGQISVGRDYFAVVPINRSLGRHGSHPRHCSEHPRHGSVRVLLVKVPLKVGFASDPSVPCQFSWVCFFFSVVQMVLKGNYC